MLRTWTSSNRLRWTNIDGGKPPRNRQAGEKEGRKPRWKRRGGCRKETKAWSYTAHLKSEALNHTWRPPPLQLPCSNSHGHERTSGGNSDAQKTGEKGECLHSTRRKAENLNQPPPQTLKWLRSHTTDTASPRLQIEGHKHSSKSPGGRSRWTTTDYYISLEHVDREGEDGKKRSKNRRGRDEEEASGDHGHHRGRWS